MADTQTLTQPDFDASKPITFTPNEWTVFRNELDKQFAAGNGVNILNTLYSIRYLAMLENCFKQLGTGTGVMFTSDEWDAFIEAQEFYLETH